MKYGFDDARVGNAYEERTYASQGGQMLRRILTEWATTGPIGSWSEPSATRDPKPVKQVSILSDTGTAEALVAIVENRYEQASQPLNLTSVTQYGYMPVDQTTAETGNIASFMPVQSLALRTTETTYVDTPSYSLRNLSDLPSTVTIRKGGLTGTPVAQTVYLYDENNYAPLTYGAAFDRWLDPQTSARGSATTIRSWLNTDNSFIEKHTRYDQFGNLVKSWDAKGNISETVYDSPYAYPTKSITPVPDQTAEGGYGSRASFETVRTFDPETGLLLSITNPNGQLTSYSYRDAQNNPEPLNRLVKVTRPDGGWTRYEYGELPGNFYLRIKLALDETRSIDSYDYFDGLGRVARKFNFDGSSSAHTWSVTNTEYDNMGHASRVSNPYFAPDLSGATLPSEWTTTEFDKLGRITSITTPDGAQMLTSYKGNESTVTDQSGRVWRSVSDVFGRLIQVYEAPNISGYNYLTTYEYDPLDNLRVIIQGQQRREFTYDSLKRLTSTLAPESGTTTYQYDLNGNLEKKTDARGVNTHYVYDSFNRLIKRTNSLAGATPLHYVSSPAVTYHYDGMGMPTNVAAPLNANGSLTAVKSSATETIYTEFDLAGRVTKHRQITDGKHYLMEYGYDLTGSLIREQYHSGRVVTTELDSAGRIAGVIRPAGGYYVGGGATDVNRIRYAEHGAIKDVRLGNGLWEHTAYNSRLQPKEIGLGSSAGAVDKFKIAYGYGLSDNNGNVQSQTIEAPGSLSLVQAYSYDPLNRLLTARETNTVGGAETWKQGYAYSDQNGLHGQFGNRRIDSATTSLNALPPYNPNFNPANNRIADNQGYQYDAAGNLFESPNGFGGVNEWDYNTENRLARANNGQLYQIAEYVYDGDGRRVKKMTGSGSVTTVFVYDVMGRVVEEYTNVVPAANGTKYLTHDHLSSPRVITNSTGDVVGRHDFRPFGDEIDASVGGRHNTPGYGQADKLRQKFTGYERDDETGLDYANARYFANSIGRFTTPDPLSESGKQELPQSWNRYAYVLNNPLKFVDPSGLIWAYHWLDKGHTRLAIVWFDDPNDIPKSKEWGRLAFGPDNVRAITLVDGRVAVFNANSPVVDVYGSPVRSKNSGATANMPLVRAIGQRAQHIPKFTAGFALVSLNGYALAGSSLLLLDAAAMTGIVVHSVREEHVTTGAAVAGSTETKYEKMTGGKRSILNVQSDITPDEFIKNLEDSGYTRSVSKDGNAVILDNGTNKYSVYPKSTSGGVPSAQLEKGGEKVLKIRLRR